MWQVGCIFQALPPTFGYAHTDSNLISRPQIEVLIKEFTFHFDQLGILVAYWAYQMCVEPTLSRDVCSRSSLANSVHVITTHSNKYSFYKKWYNVLLTILPEY